jgi:hypothetical protein
MKINANEGDVIILGTLFSILIKKQSNGTIEGWPVNNNQLTKLLPGVGNTSIQLIKNNTLAVFYLKGHLGTITWYPEKQCEVFIGKNKCKVWFPNIIIAYSEELNFIRIAGSNDIENGKFKDNPNVFSLSETCPNFIESYTVCFGKENLPQDPDKIYHEFLTRPFDGGRSIVDLRNPDGKSTVPLINILTI